MAKHGLFSIFRKSQEEPKKKEMVPVDPKSETVRKQPEQHLARQGQAALDAAKEAAVRQKLLKEDSHPESRSDEVKKQEAKAKQNKKSKAKVDDQKKTEAHQGPNKTAKKKQELTDNKKSAKEVAANKSQDAKPAEAKNDKLSQKSDKKAPQDEQSKGKDTKPKALRKIPQPIVVAFHQGKDKVDNDFVFTADMGTKLTMDKITLPKGFAAVGGLERNYAITDKRQSITLQVKPYSVRFHIVPVNADEVKIGEQYDKQLEGQPGKSIEFDKLPKVPGYGPSNLRTYNIPDKENETIKVAYEAEDQTVHIVCQTKSGQQLAESNITGKTGTKYEVKPDEHKFKGYELAGAPTNLRGIFSTQPQTVTMTYKPVEEQITVSFLDEIGNSLHRPLTYTGNYGDEYSIKLPVIDGYEYAGKASQLNGTFVLENKQVVLKYKRSMQQFKVNFWLDEHHNHGAAESKTIKGLTGDHYEVKVPQLDGYVPDHAVISGQFDRFKNPDIDVIYHPQKAQLQVSFHDTLGRPVEYKPIKKEGRIGENYSIDLPKINGYERPQEKLVGVFDAKQRTLIVTYKPHRSQVRVAYVNDKNHSPLAEVKARTLTGLVGTAYHLEPKMIDGYRLPKLPKNASGIFQPETQDVVFRYLPNPSKVVVHRVDMGQNALSEPKALTGDFGQKYDLNKYASKPINGYDFQGTTDDLTGTFPSNRKDIYLYYQAQSVSFTLIPVDQFGKVIDRHYDIQIRGLIGQEFSNQLPQIPGYVSRAMEVGGTIKADMNDQKIKIQYDPQPASVLIHYQCIGGTHDGENPFADYALNGVTGEKYEYQVPSLTGYTPDETVLKGAFPSKPETIDVHYRVQKEHYVVQFVDTKGELVGGMQPADGVYGDVISFAKFIPDGFHLPIGADSSLILSGAEQYRVEVIPDTLMVELITQTQDGQDLQARQQINGQYHQPQTIQVPTVPGYKPIKGDTVTINFELGVTSLPIYYEAQERQITVRCIDTQGNSLQAPQVVKGHYGESYNLQAPRIQGFFVVGDSHKSGRFSIETATETAFIYRAGSDKLNRAVTPLEDVIANDHYEQPNTTIDNFAGHQEHDQNYQSASLQDDDFDHGDPEVVTPHQGSTNITNPAVTDNFTQDTPSVNSRDQVAPQSGVDQPAIEPQTVSSTGHSSLHSGRAAKVISKLNATDKVKHSRSPRNGGAQ